NAQEDSLRLQWLGKGLAGVQFDSRETFDFTRETNGDVFLVLNVRVDQAPKQPVALGMACGPQCLGEVRIDSDLRALPAAAWKRLAVPLKCFGKAGADMSRISTGFALRTAGAMDLAVSGVGLGVEWDRKASCAQ
ncbi:MAG: putative glycoside hydrolase, partial [Gammaproteobacteria bacterium]